MVSFWWLGFVLFPTYKLLKWINCRTYHLWDSIVTTASSFREKNKKRIFFIGVMVSKYHKNTAVIEPRHCQKESSPFLYSAKSRLKGITFLSSPWKLVSGWTAVLPSGRAGTVNWVLLLLFHTPLSLRSPGQGQLRVGWSQRGSAGWSCAKSSGITHGYGRQLMWAWLGWITGFVFWVSFLPWDQ